MAKQLLFSAFSHGTECAQPFSTKRQGLGNSLGRNMNPGPVGGGTQCVELKLGSTGICVKARTCHEICLQSKFWIIFDIFNTRSLLGVAQKHICNIIEEIVFRNCTFLLLSKTISSIMFQICF